MTKALKKNKSVFACGDFNKDISEFTIINAEKKIVYNKVCNLG